MSSSKHSEQPNIDRDAVRVSSRTVVAILFFALLIRLFSLQSQSLSMDEALEYETAMQSIRLIILDSNSFPPLYHLILKYWMWASEHELAARMLSVVLGSVGLWGLWFSVARVVNERVGFWTLIIASFSPYHIYYSQYGRPYILYLTLACCAVGSFLIWAREGSPRARLAFIAFSLLGGYTHYYFAVLLLTLGLLAIPTFGWRFVKTRLFPVAILIGVLCVPLLLLLKTDLAYQRDIAEHRSLSITAVGYTYFSLGSGYTLGPSRGELHTLPAATAIRAVLPWAMALGIVLLPLVVTGGRYLYQRGQFGFWFGLLTLPTALIGLLSVASGVTYNTRFLIWLILPLSVIVGAGVASIPRRARVVFILALAMLSSTAIFNRHFVERYAREDSRSVAEFLVNRMTRPAITCSGYMSDPINYYLGQRGSVIGLPDPGEREGSVDVALQHLATEYAGQRIWLVYSREYHGDPDGRILRFATGEEDPKPVYSVAGIRVFDCTVPIQAGGGPGDEPRIPLNR